MNDFMKERVKQVLSDSIRELIDEIERGDFELLHKECACGQYEHRKSASYCSNCGEKIKRTAPNDPL